MDSQVAKAIVDKVIGQVFGYNNPLSLEQVLAKFAFDIKLPQKVYDSTTNEPTWASSANPVKFVSFENSIKLPPEYWEKPTRPINSIEDLLGFWAETNVMASERYLDSINVAESDDVRHSENVYGECSNSFNVQWSTKITNSMFIQNCANMQDSMFCSHLNSKRFYIANMQYSETDYKRIKDMVVRWILTA